jgi:O-antigen ligase
MDDSQCSPLLGAMVWVLVVLMIVPDGLDYQSLGSVGVPSSGSSISRALWLGLLVLGALIICWRAGVARLLLGRLNPYLVVLLVLAGASVFWSIDPDLTLRRIVRLVTIFSVCIAFTLMGWHARRFQNVLRPVLTLVLLGSLIFGLMYPQLAIHQETSPELIGAWRGLTNHKNGLGALACVSLIFWVHAGLTRQVRVPIVLAGSAIALTCLVLSRSSTGMLSAFLVTLLLVALLGAPLGMRRHVPLIVILLAGALLLCALAVLQLIPGLDTLAQALSALTDKPTTFTGRTLIWATISEHIGKHPLLGSGYAAYWTPTPSPGDDAYAFIEQTGSFYPGSAHNGYLEVANDLGWVGLIALVGYIGTLIKQSLRLAQTDYAQGALYLALIFDQLITNSSESHWFSVLSIDFIIVTLATTALARGLLEGDLRQSFGVPRRQVAVPALGEDVSTQPRVDRVLHRPSAIP